MIIDIDRLLSVFDDEASTLYLCDTFSALEHMPAGYVDMIFADPPYFLSNDAITADEACIS